MPSSKNNSGSVWATSAGATWRRYWPAVVLIVLFIVSGVFWLVWTDRVLWPRPTGETPVKQAKTQELHADGGAKGAASWISFERVLLLAVVVANYLLLAVVAWRLWRGRRSDIGNDLSQRLQAIGAQLEAIERALRAGPPKSITPPAPATQEAVPKPAGYEASREPAPPPVSRPTAEPMQRRRGLQAPPSTPARTQPVDESRSSESNARQLVNQYCLGQGASIVDLREHAQALGLQIGSPSSTPRQRNSLKSTDPDTRLLAIKDSHEEKFFVVVGADASVTEMEWLDLFERRGFPGYRDVRSKRPAVVDAVSGEVEEKGELEVLG